LICIGLENHIPEVCDKAFAICGKDFFAVCRYNRDIKLKEISIMDTKKVGLFLKQLRKENNMTQEQLGEKNRCYE